MLTRWPLFIASALVLSVPSLAWAQPDAAADEENKPQVVPPKQTRFVEAEYPEEARKQGVQANVVLRLMIDAEGKVTEATVHQGAGQGFDEAAQKAALQFQFEPAHKEGQPIAAIILYQYRFTLKQAPLDVGPGQPPSSTPPPPMTTSVVTVKVVIGGTPIAGASVTLRGPNLQVFNQNANEAGVANFKNVPPGTYRVSVQSDGFQPYTHDENALVGRETTVTYALVPAADEGLEVVIRGEVRRDVTVRKIKHEEFTLVPGGAGDPIRVVESLPGVARSSEGELIIRGASPWFSGVFLDGMPIPFLYHLYQVTSVVPADMVEDVTLYPGNYGVKNGRFIGGIVEVGMQSPNTKCTGDYGIPTREKGCYHGSLQLDFLEGRAMVEGPVPGTDHWSFAVSARRSWIDYLLQKAIETTDISVRTAPRYYDGYALVEYEKGDEKLSLRAYASLDEVALLIPETEAGDVTEVGGLDFEYGFERLQAVYENQLDDGLKLSSMIGVGRDHVTLTFDEIEIEYNSKPIAFRHELLTELSPLVGMNVGVDLFTAPYHLFVRAPQTDALTPVELKRVDGTDATFGAFLEVPLRPTERSSVVPGVRIDHTPLFSETTLSPRLLARYDLVKQPERTWLSRTTVKGGAGMYYQAPPIALQYYDEILDQQSMRARQYSLGIEQELHKKLELSVEGFYIDRDRLFSPEQKDDGSFRVTNEGTGETYGMEVFLRYHSDERFFGWIAYTLSKTEEQGTESVIGEDRFRSFPADYDQRHNLIVLGSYDVGAGWRLGARFRYVSGNPFTDVARPPLAQSVFYGPNGTYIPQFTERNAERFPDMHQLDLRVDKRWDFRVWSLTTYLDIRNVTNHRVVDSYAYNYDFTQREGIQGLPLLPILGAKGEF
jgi:TonB family protein